jgi:NADH:ubiquinone oxidoreductase subunit 2 (subunit N)
MPIDLSTSAGVTLALLPEIILTAWALGLLLFIGWRHSDPEAQRGVGWWTLAGLVAALGAVMWLWTRGAAPVGLPLMLALDGFRWATATVFLLGAIAATVLRDRLPRRGGSRA